MIKKDGLIRGVQGGNQKFCPKTQRWPRDQKRLYNEIAVKPCYFWCRDQESNQGHTDFQSVALPTELSRREGWKVQKGWDLVKIFFSFAKNDPA